MPVGSRTRVTGTLSPTLSTALGRHSLPVPSNANLQKDDTYENPSSVGSSHPRCVYSNHGSRAESSKRRAALDPKFGWIFEPGGIRQSDSFWFLSLFPVR